MKQNKCSILVNLFFLHRPTSICVSMRITYTTSHILKMANAVLEIQQTCIKTKPKIIDPYSFKT